MTAEQGAPRLGERLVASHLISEGQLRRALELQPQTSRLLGAVLIELGVVDEDRLTVVLSEHLDIPVVETPEGVQWVDNIHPASEPES